MFCFIDVLECMLVGLVLYWKKKYFPLMTTWIYSPCIMLGLLSWAMFENKDVLAFIVHQVGAQSVKMMSLHRNEHMIYNPWEKRLRRTTSFFFLSSTSRYLKMAHLCKRKIFLTSDPCLDLRSYLSTFVVKLGMCNRDIFFSCFALVLVCWYIVYLQFQWSSFF